jgi:hypothetical protein
MAVSFLRALGGEQGSDAKRHRENNFVCRHCEKRSDEAIKVLSNAGLLRFARNDERRSRKKEIHRCAPNTPAA